MLRVLHVIDRLSGAGPTRSMIALVKYLGRLGVAQQHRAVTLQGDAYPLALLLAKQAGLTILRAPDRATMRHEVEGADIVQLHHWNNPAIGEWLRDDLPAMRLLLWFKILGCHAPQVITRDLLAAADGAVATTPATLDLPAARAALAADPRAVEVVAGIADGDRLQGLCRRPHAGFTVGYIGTVNFTKMHPRFVAMNAAVRVPEARFIVCGAGDPAPLRAEAARLGAADRFELRGYVEDVAAVLGELDVFGYPLCADTYATSEKSLQEAMLAGVPPVVFPHGGVPHLVRHGDTGLVVDDELAYRDAIEHLHRDPAERARLGDNARAFAAQAFDGLRAARQFADIYARVLERPKRCRARAPSDLGVSARELGPDDGARRFVEAIGDAAPQFRSSLTATEPAAWGVADRQIADSSPLLASGEGGIFHYRNYYPQARHLRLWAGLVLLRQGRAAEATREFETARALGLGVERVAAHLAAARQPAEV